MKKDKLSAGEKAIVTYAHESSDKTLKKLQAAMKAIELDIEQNEGIYPLHGGRLSVAEVCRRAGVHKVTLHGDAHKDTTKPMVSSWLNRVKAKLITGRKTVRRTVTERADNWKEKYEKVANQFNQMYVIEVIARDEKLRELTQRVAELEAENLMLRSEQSGGKVVRFPDSRAQSAPQHQPKPARLVLIRGVPGSGKSTRAARLKQESGYDHVEADMFFLKEGRYVFDPAMLPLAHDWCLGKARDALNAGRSVVVANVFETAESVRPYLLLGYPCEIIDANGRWKSAHGVPQDKIAAMRAHWQSKEQLIRELSKPPEKPSRKGKS